MAKEIKTNAMRILEKNGIDYKLYTLDIKEALDGVSIAKLLNVTEDNFYKTLVTVGKSREHYVFMIPVKDNLDLKKGAKVVGEKDIEMIPLKELLPLTGYVHGGCSPVGMKKQFKTVINDNCRLFNDIYFSGGKIGVTVNVNKDDFINKMNVIVADIVR